MSDPNYINIGEPEDKIIEECAELIQAIIKAKRFGWFNYHPDRPESTNYTEVMKEILDVTEAIDRWKKSFHYIPDDH
jgi:hypothetical protein